MSWRFEVHQSLASTSDLCKHYADTGHSGSVAVVALQQTQGRGTHGRSWSSATGNLAVSFLLRPDPMVSFLTAAPFLASVSLYDTIEGLCTAKSVPNVCTIKWPNDLLLHGKKIAGILIESGGSGLADRAGWVVIGVGVNIRIAPVIPMRRTGTLTEMQIDVDPVVMARKLGESLNARLEEWHAKGFEPIREAWLSAAHPYGTHLAVKQGKTYIRGEFSGIDSVGRLLLTQPSGEILSVVAGETFLD